MGILIALLLIWVGLGILGLVIKGLLWLGVAALVAFVLTCVFGAVRLLR